MCQHGTHGKTTQLQRNSTSGELGGEADERGGRAAMLPVMRFTSFEEQRACRVPDRQMVKDTHHAAC